MSISGNKVPRRLERRGIYTPPFQPPLRPCMLHPEDDDNGEPRYTYLGSPLCGNLPCHAKIPNQFHSAEAILKR